MTAEIERDSLGEPEAPSLERDLPARPARRAGVELDAGAGEDLVEVPVVSGGEERVEQGWIEAATGTRPSVERDPDEVERTPTDTVVHVPAEAFTRLSSLSPRNREHRSSSRSNVARTVSTADPNAGDAPRGRCNGRASPSRGTRT